ncbi:hypothetical protein [Cellvibrio sp. PSBB006]|jgi:hypothetical protein|uniref:ribbon-helix-helix domain-containing protein n=1 Tax=Cellvibrio sp. PSBB006 TaxID=1987723 RepID=UPI000B3B6AB4|nr:hypothetical protein [Cellvibrio sp. PSBB006]ARU28990.1 hypothetical protein CBR65_16940 [Cellvibrio sp. PSBB006]
MRKYIFNSLFAVRQYIASEINPYNEYIVFIENLKMVLVLSSKVWKRLFLYAEFTGSSSLLAMKKEVVLTLRVDTEINNAIRLLAKRQDRTVAWMARKLIAEALEQRKLLRPEGK